MRTWIPLYTLKESNPIELAEYYKIRKIDDQPAVAWWVDWTLKKKERVKKAVQHRIQKKLMKFGVQISGSVEKAYILDEENSNDLWRRAIEKEMKNVMVAFKLLQDNKHLPVRSKEIPYHNIYDVNLTLQGRQDWLQEDIKINSSQIILFTQQLHHLIV